MSEENTVRAVVRALDGDDAIVEVESGGCGRCHEEGGCGGQNLTQMLCGGPKTYRAENRIGAGVGDRVAVAIAAGSIRKSANLAYGVPLFAAILGAAIGSALGGDLLAVLGAALGLAVSVVYIRFRSRDRSGVLAQRPHIVSRS